MSYDNIGGLLFAVVAVLVVGYLLSRVLKHGGIKAVLFGARIKRTVGTVEGSGSKSARTSVTVHALGSPDKKVGLEVSAKTIASYQMLPASLTAEEAEQLASHLREAARYGNSI